MESRKENSVSTLLDTSPIGTISGLNKVCFVASTNLVSRGVRSKLAWEFAPTTIESSGAEPRPQFLTVAIQLNAKIR